MVVRFGTRALGVAVLVVFAFSALGVGVGQAADDVGVFPVANALARPDAKKKLDGSVAFYFGKAKHSKVVSSLGSFSAVKKSNSFWRADNKSCDRALISVLIEFQKRAKDVGGNAVVNIRSNYDGNEVSYDDQFQCYSGTLMSGVSLKGDIVKLKR